MPRRLTRRNALALLGSAGLSGCSVLDRREQATPSFANGPAEWVGDPAAIPDDAWPMVKRTAARTASTPAAGPADAPTDKAWERPVYEYNTYPSVRDGTVYLSALGEDGRIEAVDAADGTQSWQWNRATLPPSAAAGDMLFALTSGDDSTKSGGVTAYETTNGVEQWHYSLPHLDRTVVVTDAAVLVGTTGGDVVAIDQASGELIWRFDPGDPHYHVRNLAVDGMVYFATSGTEPDDSVFGLVNAFDPNRGELAWSVEFDTGDLAVAAGTVVVTTETEVIALEADTGDERWRQAPSESPSGHFALAEDTVVVPTSTGTVAYETTSGRRRWDVPGVRGSVIGGDTVYANGTDRYAAYDLRTGEYRWSFSDFSDVGAAVPALAGDRLYTVTNDDRLVAWE